MSSLIMRSQYFEKLLLFFNFCGYYTQLKRSTFRTKCNLLIFFVHIIYASATTYAICIDLNKSGNDKLGKSNDVLKFLILILHNWLSIFESYFKQNVQINFWDCVKKIHRKLSVHQDSMLHNFMMQFTIYFGIQIFANATFLKHMLFKNGFKYVYFWWAYASLTIISTIRSFYYLFHLELVKYELNVIDFEIKRRKKSLFIKRLYQNRFKWVRQFHELIFEMRNTINTLFAWSSPITIILPFHLILVDLNWFYMKILSKYQFNRLGESEISHL